MVAVWTLTPQESAQDDLHLVSVSIESMANRLAFADWMAGFVLDWSDGSKVHRYQGEKIYQFSVDQSGSSPAFFGWNGGLFAAPDLAMAQRAVDQLHSEPGTASDQTNLELLLAQTRATDPLRAALTNHNGEGYRLWETIAGGAVEFPQQLEALEGVVLTGGLQSDGAFEATVELIAPDANWSEADVQAMEVAFGIGLEMTHLEVEARTTVVEDGLQVEVRIPNLVESLTRLLERAR